MTQCKRVLIIDDSRAVRRQVCRALTRVGYETPEAVDGLDGAEQLRSQQPITLVLCDINMPGMNGLDLLESVQEALARRRIPVVMLTTVAKTDAIARAGKAGARAWIVKPFQDELLIACVNRLTG